jgi:hypothetical protein
MGQAYIVCTGTNGRIISFVRVYRAARDTPGEALTWQEQFAEQEINLPEYERGVTAAFAKQLMVGANADNGPAFHRRDLSLPSKQTWNNLRHMQGVREYVHMKKKIIR